MNRTKWLAMALALVCAAALAGCGGAGETSSSDSGSTSTDISLVAPVEPPEPVMPFVNPLTGEGCQTDVGRNRPVAIMLNNLQKALPQMGVSQADIIYEMVAEGGITRMMGVFQSVDGVGEIGTVRSARDYYVSLALGHDAVFLHAGGSPQAYQMIKEKKVTALDCVNGPYEGTLYWRDKARRKRAGKEHSVLTSGETISTLLPTYKGVTLTHRESFTEPLVFLGPDEKAQGQPASAVSIRFSHYKTGIFTYDEATGLYRVSQYDGPYVDGNTGEQVAVKNVLVLYTDQRSVKGDDKGRQSLRTTGTGKGQFFCDGTVQDILWSKKTDAAPMYYTTPNGQPLALGVGHSYVNMVSASTEVTVT